MKKIILLCLFISAILFCGEAAEKARIYIRCYKADLLAAYRLNENKKEQNLSVFSLIYGII